jgi:hypothetical protein
MSVELKPPSQHHVQRALDALFREAPMLERRRRRRNAIGALMACAAVAGVANGAIAASDTAGSARGERPASVAQHDSATATGGLEYPFGSVSVTPDGVLYYVDRQYGQIDEVNGHRSRIVLSSLPGTAAPSESIPGLSGLVVTKRSIWFTATGGLYEATLAGRDVHRIGSAPGAVNLDVLADGTILYSTSGAYTATAGVYERTVNGTRLRVAGGGAVPFAEQSLGEHPATALEDINPGNLVGVNAHTFYFVNENDLYLVDGGEASMLRPQQAFFNGELAAGGGGAIYGICDLSLCRINGHTFTPLFKLPTRINGIFAAPAGLAISARGAFYISYSSQSVPGRAGIVELSTAGKIIGVAVSRTT